jgi:hypothetical protein
MPVLVLVLTDLLQMTLTGRLLLLALLAFQLGFDSLAFVEQPGVGDVLTRWWRRSGLVLAQSAGTSNSSISTIRYTCFR